MIQIDMFATAAHDAASHNALPVRSPAPATEPAAIVTGSRVTKTENITMKTPRSEYRQTLDGVLHHAARNCGFLDSADLAIIAACDRLRQVLVRCGAGRFTCPAQDAAHFMACVAAGGDYVRDVSLLASDTAMKKPAADPAPRISGDISHLLAFREEDCSGAFDGNTVTSDADPGL